jgi:hypothetical protein
VGVALAAWRGWILAPAGQSLQTADYTRYFDWIHAYVRDRLLAGHLPLWNPYNYAGQPFAANPQVTLFYPPSWLHLALPLPLAHRAMVVLHAVMAGTFMLMLLRRLKLGPLAALAGSLPWMLGSYFVANAVVGHLPMVFTAAWLPLAVWCYEGALARGRLAGYTTAGAVMGVQVLAGEPQNCYYSGLALAAWALTRHAAGGRARAVLHRGLPSLLVAGATAVLVAAVQLLPTLEMMAHSDRRQRSYVFATSASFEPASALGFLLPWSSSVRLILDDTTPPAPLVNLSWEHAAYVGLLTLALAAAARRRHSQWVLPSLVVLGLGSVLSLGGATPLYRLLFAGLPGLALFRVPSRALLLVVFALSVLCAHGLQALLDGRRPRHWKWSMLVLLLAAAAAWTWALQAGIPVLVGDTFDRIPGAVRGRAGWITLSDRAGLLPLAALLLTAGFVAASGRLRPRALGPAAVALLALDLLAAQPALPLANTAAQAEQEALRLQLLREGTGTDEPFRVDMAPGHIGALTALAARVENVNGYWPVALRRFYRYVHAQRGVAADPMTRHQLHDPLYATTQPFALALLNVRFASVLHPGWEPGNQSYSLKSANRWMPRAWVVDRAEVVADEEAALARVAEPGFDFMGSVVLESAPALSLAGSGRAPGTARARRLDDAVLEIETETVRDGYLVLSEVHYPGWKATVDGRPAPLQRADYVLTALPLPAGRHRVLYTYAPASVRAGAALTAVTALSLAVVAVRSARARRAVGRVLKDPA